jgi:hypothetical protein
MVKCLAAVLLCTLVSGCVIQPLPPRPAVYYQQGYSQPQTYYAPAPTYYAPPPAYYAPSPPVYFGPGRGFGRPPHPHFHGHVRPW